jgi:hypothetical protein
MEPEVTSPGTTGIQTMISLKRPLIEMSSRLQDIPIEWLRLVEPKLVRGPYLPCWIWVGLLDQKGHPLIRNPASNKVEQGHRFVASLFWDFPPHFYVKFSCQHTNCLNPKHLIPTERAAPRLKAEAV